MSIEPAFTPIAANLRESADAAGNVSTAYTMQVDDRFVGSISTGGDDDWVAVQLQAGQSYVIALGGAGGGVGTLGDPFLRLYDASGRLAALNDDGGPGYDSKLVFTPAATGAHFVSARSYYPSQTGTYQISVTANTAPSGQGTVGTLDDMATFLTEDFWDGQPRSFDTSSSNVLTVNITALTAAGQNLARQALDAWEMVADLRFVEVSGSADISFDDNQPGAIGGSSYDLTGRILSAQVNVSADWISNYGSGLDSFTFSTYIHEIGHALGLGHQGHYDGSGTYAQDAYFSNDSYQLSIMSYFSQTENTTVQASYAEPITPMMVDIIAIQQLYGAAGAGSVTTGNTVWGEGSTVGNYLDELYGPDTIGAVAWTIYDRSGIDTLNLASSTADNRIDLRPEALLDVGGLLGNIAIARGTLIENAVTGAGDDLLQGNYAANLLSAAGGNDELLGGGGADTLFAGAGDDRLDGGDGNDGVWGGTGNDTAFGGAGNDTLGGAAGNDSLSGGAGNDALWASWGNDTAFGGDGNDTLGGFDGDDSLEGGAGNDEIWGADGTDTLRGGDGADQLGGGAGNDDLNGHQGNDSLYGGLGNDTVLGGWGDDLIFGAAGDDSLDGGAGNDTLYAGPGADVVVFGLAGGADELQFFSPAEDRLQLDDALWGGGLSAAQVVTQFGSDQGAHFVLDFGGGDTITLFNQAGITGLESQIDIV